MVGNFWEYPSWFGRNGTLWGNSAASREEVGGRGKMVSVLSDVDEYEEGAVLAEEVQVDSG